ncbi:transcriptional regulator [Solimicrobium silvestre]|uniref:Transcriptional regulator n=1 Tax=Solimicrobium silvestre TaxID=2099400 RepID=A0A2S9GVR5_9BURK|nr:transcriptional regulator [Solimicrobium silvestre]PRC91813.1 hypothetical protein S2091_3568 [Solimicrobium silvestre]
MELIEPDEMRKFQAILKNHQITFTDFSFSEIDTTDPKTDEIYALQGFLNVTRKSNGLSKEYLIGDGTAWVSQFQKDLDEGAFT